MNIVILDRTDEVITFYAESGCDETIDQHITFEEFEETALRHETNEIVHDWYCPNRGHMHEERTVNISDLWWNEPEHTIKMWLKYLVNNH
jgi:hypothetical protein